MIALGFRLIISSNRKIPLRSGSRTSLCSPSSNRKASFRSGFSEVTLAPLRTNIGKRSHTMAQSADGLREDTPRQHRTVTPSTALAKLTEVIDRIKSLTRLSTAKDVLWDVTESMLRTLRNRFNSRLWLLKALWYAEPFRLVTVGRWLSRIDEEKE